MARVVVIEDDERVRRALQSVFRGRAELLAYTTLAAARADEHVPRDAMIIDHGLPDGDGLAYALSIAERYPAIPITLFTGHTWSEVGRHASAKGIGFAEKPDGISQIHRLAEYLEARPRDEGALTAARLERLKQRAPSWRLSARERDAARLAVEGLARDAMATRLGIGPGSVKNLVTRLLKKCGFASLARTEREPTQVDWFSADGAGPMTIRSAQTLVLDFDELPTMPAGAASRRRSVAHCGVLVARVSIIGRA